MSVFRIRVTVSGFALGRMPLTLYSNPLALIITNSRVGVENSTFIKLESITLRYFLVVAVFNWALATSQPATKGNEADIRKEAHHH